MAYPGSTTFPGAGLFPSAAKAGSRYCWPVNWGCVSEEEYDAFGEDVIAYAEDMAASTLRALTLYQVGGCSRTVRPCAATCNPGLLGSLGWSPHINASGNWVNVSCGCGRPEPCSCGAVPTVLLPTPVGRVDEVVIDGAVLDPSAYRVDSGGRLVRTDGGSWPLCQDMRAAPGEEGTFTVTYLNAYPVDPLGAWVSGRLAYEYAKSCTGGTCSLPSGITEITRQGITMEIQLDMFAQGLTGIREVDDWTARYNPNRLRRKPRVYTPDLPEPRQTLGI